MVRSSLGKYWSPPSLHRYTPTVSGYPIHEVQHKPVEVAPKPKIVQIPVRFVGSESTRSASALKIQKVFRGFLVRRSMNRIISVRREVDEIERKVSQSETAELLQRDERERIRMNEILMSLLFKLDSVRGVDSGVRNCRKSVTRKAIALQERIDAIVNSGLQTVTDNNECSCNGSSEIALETETGDNHANDDTEAVKVCDYPGSELPQSVDQAMSINDSSENVFNSADHSAQKVDVLLESEVFPVEANCGGNAIKSDLEDDECNEAHSMGGFVSVVTSPDVEHKKEEPDMAETRNGEDENKKNRELMEKMMEESGKMMRLMTQLSERNEAQMIMLEALTQRVEQLEKAFTGDRLRRKKMKKKHNTPS